MFICSCFYQEMFFDTPNERLYKTIRNISTENTGGGQGEGAGGERAKKRAEEDEDETFLWCFLEEYLTVKYGDYLIVTNQTIR